MVGTCNKTSSETEIINYKAAVGNPLSIQTLRSIIFGVGVIITTYQKSQNDYELKRVAHIIVPNGYGLLLCWYFIMSKPGAAAD